MTFGRPSIRADGVARRLRTTSMRPPRALSARRFGCLGVDEFILVRVLVALLLAAVFTLFALLAVNALYLGSITFLEWSSGAIYQDYFYQLNMLFHLGTGLLLIAPFAWFGIAHMRRALRQPNPRAIRIGIASKMAAETFPSAVKVLTCRLNSILSRIRRLMLSRISAIFPPVSFCTRMEMVKKRKS